MAMMSISLTQPQNCWEKWQCVKTNSTPGTPFVHIKIAGLKWMFIPLKMVLICIFIGIDPYPNPNSLLLSPPFVRCEMTSDDQSWCEKKTWWDPLVGSEFGVDLVKNRCSWMIPRVIW